MVSTIITATPHFLEVMKLATQVLGIDFENEVLEAMAKMAAALHESEDGAAPDAGVNR